MVNRRRLFNLLSDAALTSSDSMLRDLHVNSAVIGNGDLTNGLVCSAPKREPRLFLPLGINLLAVISAFVIVGFAGAQRAYSFSDTAHDSRQTESVEPTTPRTSRKRLRLVDKIVPVVPVWTAISHNPLVMGLRFHGVVKALRKEIDIGALRVPNLGKAAKIRLAGTRKIDGETLPFLSIRYPGKGVPAVGAPIELANMRGSISSLSLDFAVRVPTRSDKKLAFAYVDPGRLAIDVQQITGSESTGFGAPVPFSVGETLVTNPVAIAVKRSGPTLPLWATGELRLEGRDLNFNQADLSFSGENNTLRLAGHVSMPNELVWNYDLFERRLIWKSGQLQIANLLLEPEPQHQINFGGIALTLNTIKVDTISITKTEFPDTALPLANLTGVTLDASDLDYKGTTLKGTLKAPITIKQIDGQIDFKSFTDINLLNQRVQDLQLGMMNISYQNSDGLQVNAGSLDVTVPKYTSTEVEGAAPDTSVTASIVLKNAPVTQEDMGSFQIDQLSADLQGPIDKLNGRGNLQGTLTNVRQQIPIDLSQLLGQDCSDGNARIMHLSLTQTASAPVNADIDVFNGEPRGIATVSQIAVNLLGGYGRYDWDGNPFSVTVSGVPVDIAKIHWEARFDPDPLGVDAALVMAEVRFSKQGAKICRGHAAAAGLGIWHVSVNPTFNDCGFWLCNIPRDVVNAFWGAYEFPYVTVLNLAAIGIVDTVGLFDAGILCQ